MHRDRDAVAKPANTLDRDRENASVAARHEPLNTQLSYVARSTFEKSLDIVLELLNLERQLSEAACSDATF